MGARRLFLAALWHHVLPWQAFSEPLSIGAEVQSNINQKCCISNVEMNIKRILLLSALVLSLASCRVNDTLRFGVITDLHYADKAPVGTRHYQESMPKLKEALGVFQKSQLDFIIELGDLKDMGAKPKREETLAFLDSVEQMFQSTGLPAYHVLGNHDMDHITSQDFISHISNPGAANGRAYYSFKVKGVKCIVLDANYNADGGHYEKGNFNWQIAVIPQPELDWLRQELADGKGDVIVFVHQLLSQTAHHSVVVKNAAQVRQMLEQSGRVRAVFQGHHHAGHYEETNGIPYITLPGVIEGAYPEENSYAVVELERNGRLLVNGYRKCADRILRTRQ